MVDVSLHIEKELITGRASTWLLVEAKIVPKPMPKVHCLCTENVVFNYLEVKIALYSSAFLGKNVAKSAGL
jgi:hypothetical protein